MPKIENKILSDHVYDTIRRMILDGDLSPGIKINKNDLVKRLDVSLTPINASISRLVGERLIEQRSRYGFFVKEYDCKELQDLYAVRAGLEGVAIRLCIEDGCEEHLEHLSSFFRNFTLPMNEKDLKEYAKTDKLFHTTIIKYSGNRMMEDMNSSYAYIMRSYQKGLIRPPGETLKEHLQIVEAIEQRDGFLAQELILQHLLRSKDVLHQHCEG